MLPIKANIPLLTQEGFFGQAEILDSKQGKYRVKITSDKPHINGKQVWATPALSSGQELTWGDKILLAGDEISDLYIIGVICIRESRQTLRLTDGALVEKTRTEGAEKVTLKSSKGEMMFEYNADTGKTVVNIENGDLEFATQNGRIDFTASKGIRFFSERPIEFKSLEKIKFAGQKIETAVETIMEKAKNVYRSVTNLTQLRTGRIRTLVDQTSHFKARKAFHKAEEDYKIKGKKIHLG